MVIGKLHERTGGVMHSNYMLGQYELGSSTYVVFQYDKSYSSCLISLRDLVMLLTVNVLSASSYYLILASTAHSQEELAIDA